MHQILTSSVPTSPLRYWLKETQLALDANGIFSQNGGETGTRRSCIAPL